MSWRAASSATSGTSFSYCAAITIAKAEASSSAYLDPITVYTVTCW
jgi:hypothetical protein